MKVLDYDQKSRFNKICVYGYNENEKNALKSITKVKI